MCLSPGRATLPAPHDESLNYPAVVLRIGPQAVLRSDQYWASALDRLAAGPKDDEATAIFNLLYIAVADGHFYWEVLSSNGR